MSLFQSKPSAIFYLRRQDAVLITKAASVRLNIPIEVVYNLEVRDTATLSEIVAGFLKEHKTHGQPVLVVLDTATVFHKQIDAGSDSQALLKDFASKVPFEPNAKQLITVHQKGQVVCYGANKIWYEAVAAGVRRANKLKGVVPAFAYGLNEHKKIDRSIVTTFFQNGRPAREANFLTKV